MSRFNITSILNDIGVAIQVVERSSITYNTRGDISGVTLTYTNVTGVVQQFDTGDLEVREGTMKPSDIEAWFDETITISGVLAIGNFLSGSFFGTTSQQYEIKEVFQELGHYHVMASKL